MFQGDISRFNMLFYSSNTASAAAGFWAPLE